MRGAARWIPIVMLVTVLIGLAPRALRLGDVDPRGRASWTAGPLTLDDAPQDIALFVPACDARAVVLHPATRARGRVAAEFLVAAADGATTRAGATSIAVQPGDAVVLPLGDVRAPWRAPLIARVRALDDPITLDSSRPITIEPAASSRLGTLACLPDAGAVRPGWPVIVAMLTVVLVSGVLGAAWLRRVVSPVRTFTASRTAALVGVVALTAATLITYLLVVPPFEPADELAHFQYARFVATTGALPRDVPAPDSEWRGSSYEFVQQPLYYVGAAALLKVTGLASPNPQMTANPRSRMRPGGTEPTLFEHGRQTASSTAHRALWLLRLTSLAMALATALIIARLVMVVSNDALVVVTVAGGLGLIPQWCSVMGSVSTDPPATLLASAATYAIVRLARGYGQTGAARNRWCLATGLLIGAAYAIKATTVFLLPMAMLACVLDAANRVQAGAGPRLTDRAGRALAESIRPLLWIGAGAALAGGWVLVRAWLVFGDPQAFAFKKAILEAGGFVPVPGAMPWTPEFWSQMRVMVFEPFWARFGSLGAGPFPGSRVWLIYAAASIGLGVMAAIGLVGWTCAGIRHVRASSATQQGTRDGAGSRDACTMLAVTVCTIGVGAGLLAWLAVNLAPRADMVVHWTPRHIMPMTAPAALLVAAGLEWLARARPPLRAAAVSAVGLLLPGLALAWIAVLRATIMMLHFGY